MQLPLNVPVCISEEQERLPRSRSAVSQPVTGPILLPDRQVPHRVSTEFPPSPGSYLGANSLRSLLI